MKVADMFYPADREVLIQMFEVFWSKLDSFQVKNLKAGVVPHAGYVYSGQIATYTYEAIKQNLDNIPKTIFILTPDHYIWMNKILVWNYDELETPFGNLKVDIEITKILIDQFPTIFTDEYLSYDQEHALETQLPFLKYVLWEKSNEFKIVPLMFWQVDVVAVYEVLKKFEWFFIVSSDLSHYDVYNIAIEKDIKTIQSFLSWDFQTIVKIADACGIYPWLTLTLLSKEKNRRWNLLKYMNSWDTAWDKSKVVGYASVIYKTDKH